MADDTLRSVVDHLMAGDPEGRSAALEALAAFGHAVRAAGPAPVASGAVSAGLAESIRRHVPGSTIRGKLLHVAGQMTMDLARQRPDRLPIAVALHRQALEELPRGREPHSWAVVTTGLGNALSRLGEMTGEPAPLEEAERALRSALEELRHDRTPREWAMAKANLGDALRVLAEFTGEPAPLEEAEHALRSAIGALPLEASPEDRTTARMNLGNVLLRLGEATGEPARVADAAAAYRSALKTRPRGREPELWANTQANLGNALLRLGEMTREPAPLRGAVDAYRRALRVWTRDRAGWNWAMTRMHLGSTLQILAEVTGDRARLEEAVAAHRSALGGLPSRDQAPWDLALVELNLGGALAALGEMTREPASLEEAERALRSALDGLPRDRAPRDRATAQLNLGNALRALGEVTGERARFEEAEAAYRRALDTLSRARAALDWAEAQSGLAKTLVRLAAGQGCPAPWAEAAAVLQDLVADLHILVWAAETPQAQLRWLRVAQGAPDLLAHALLRQGDPEGAWRAAQRGRAVLLDLALHVGRVGGGAAGVGDGAVRGALAAWRRACAVAEAADASVVGGTPHAALERQAAARAAAEEAYRDLRRALEAAGVRPPEPPGPAELRRALPPRGVLVLPSITEFGANLFVLREEDPSGAAAPHTFLPQFTAGRLRELVSGEDQGQAAVSEHGGWLRAYADFKAAAGPDGRVPAAAIKAWNAAIEGTLDRLWNELMGPLDALLRRDLGSSSPRHVVVVPAGLLALLPLHAARRPVTQGGGYFLRDWIVSYAPSTGSYVASRARVVEAERRKQTLLAVTDPTEDLGVAENPAVEFFELDASRHLRGKAATLDAVVEALSGAAYLSFYCHGNWSPEDPGGASLVLAPGGVDGRLSVRILQDRNLQASRLAVLAACETGLVDLRQIDEVIGLPAGFLEAGVPGVVASGWPVEARATETLVRAFFRAHLKGQHPAEALREAQLAMLESRPVELARSRPPDVAEAGAARTPQSVQADGVMRIGRARGAAEPKAGPADHALPFYWAAFSFTGS